MIVAVGVSILLLLATILNPSSERALSFAESAMQHIAWPLLVLWALLSYRPVIEKLSERINEFYGAKFADPQKLPAGQDGATGPSEQLTGKPDAEGVGTMAGGPQSVVKDTTALVKGADLAVSEGSVQTNSSESPCIEESYFAQTVRSYEHHSIQTEVSRLFPLYRSHTQKHRADSEADLLFELAVTNVLAEFRSIAFMIYGSQFELLEMLRNNNRLSESESIPFMDRAFGTDRITAYQNWISFLVGRQLVFRDADGSVSITAKGKDFTDWEKRTALNLRSRPN